MTIRQLLEPLGQIAWYPAGAATAVSVPYLIASNSLPDECMLVSILSGNVV